LKVLAQEAFSKKNKSLFWQETNKKTNLKKIKKRTGTFQYLSQAEQ
jgi:hypothetical protein